MPTLADNDTADLVIIGARPVGLFASFYAGFRQMSVRIIDSLQVLGGQLVTLYPEKYIYDVPGFPKVLSKDLAANLIEQGLQYGPPVCLGQQVRRLTYHDIDNLYRIETAKAVHPARAILIAAGLGAFVPKALPMPNATAYETRGLHYFVKRLDEFRGQRILIVGGGDSAVDWANNRKSQIANLPGRRNHLPMRIYTRTGDDGSTGTYGAGRIAKSDLRIECTGCIDELNSAVGWATAVVAAEFIGPLHEIQSDLLTIGAHLATPGNTPATSRLPLFDESIISRLEMQIDAADARLPELRQFILPGGCEASARLHLARSIARRAERRVVQFAHDRPVPPVILAYLNRLSDWLFTHARLANILSNTPEIPWTP